MATERLKLVRNDTRPNLVVDITDSYGDAIIITGATVVLKFREQGASELTATLTGTVTAASQATFNWGTAPEALEGEPGNYEGEIEITFNDGSVLTVYDTLKFKMREDF